MRDTILGPTAMRVLALVARPGRPPSIAEVARACGVRVHAVQRHLDRLRRLGLVTWEVGRVRTVRPLCRLEVLP